MLVVNFDPTWRFIQLSPIYSSDTFLIIQIREIIYRFLYFFYFHYQAFCHILHRQTHFLLKNYAEAEKYYKKALDIRERLLKPDDEQLEIIRKRLYEIAEAREK